MISSKFNYHSVTLLTSSFSFLQVQLVLLNVSHNKLKSLPESIGGCIALEELQASGTHLYC